MTGSWIAFGGDIRRRESALAQMRAHREAAVFGDITVQVRTFYLYGWGRAREYRAAANALGLPESLLRLGCWLYEGYPETPDGIREQIDSYMQMLQAFRVGADLSTAGGFFCHALLTAEPWGVGLSCHTVESRRLFVEISEHLEGDLTGAGLEQFRPCAEATLQAQRDFILGRRRASEPVEVEHYETQRALQVLVPVCELGKAADVPDVLCRAAEASVAGANGIELTRPRARFDDLCRVFEDVVS